MSVKEHWDQRHKKKLALYEYKALPDKHQSIRILKLRASSPETLDVDCELVLTPLINGVAIEDPYEALSWNWGPPKVSSINIYEKGRKYRKEVRPNLVEGLKALRRQDEDRNLWIDAVCINQDNEDEKNHQVQMMAEIYSRAQRVCIWLGGGDESSRIALRFIKKEVLQLRNFDELCDSEEASKKWKALLDLMQRPWFSRRWVVQEIALARSAVIYCGDDKISWKKFAVAVELFVEVETATHRLSEVMRRDPAFLHVPNFFEHVSELGASLLVEATGKLFRDYKPHEPQEMHIESDDESNLGDESETSEERDSKRRTTSASEHLAKGKVDINRERPLLSLEYLVSSLPIFDVSHQHDSVYALLAIAKDTVPLADNKDMNLKLGQSASAWEAFMQKKMYSVNYKKPFPDVCEEFVRFCSQRSDQTRALDIICRLWAPKYSSKSEDYKWKKPTVFSPSQRSEAKHAFLTMCLSVGKEMALMMIFRTKSRMNQVLDRIRQEQPNF